MALTSTIYGREPSHSGNGSGNESFLAVTQMGLSVSPENENLGMKKTPIYHWSCLLNFVGASTSFTGKVNS
jgi:hypothetical protein